MTTARTIGGEATHAVPAAPAGVEGGGAGGETAPGEAVADGLRTAFLTEPDGAVAARHLDLVFEELHRLPRSTTRSTALRLDADVDADIDDTLALLGR